MSYINFNPTAAQGAQNALQMGLQLGARAAESANRKGFNNALMAYDPSNPDSAKEVMRYNPQVGMQLQQQSQAQQRQAQIAQTARAAMEGNNEALGQLFTLDPDMWSKLDTRQREGVKQATSIMANASMQIGRLPEDQRAQAWSAIVREAEASGTDIPAYLENYSPDVLNTAIARAEMTEKYINQFEPDWRAVPPGGYLEDVNPLTNPNVGAPPPSPQQQASNTFSFEQYQGAVNGLGPQGAAQWAERNGVVVSIADDSQYNALPSGATFRAPDGTIRRKP